MTSYPTSAKVAIVTGGGGALGHAITGTLAARGLTVVAVDRNEQAMHDLPDGVAREAADATDPNIAKSVVDRIAADVGPPDILVNTIGTFRPGEALSTTPADLHLMVDVNLGTALWLSQAVAPYMQRNGSGAIVNVSARPGLEPTAGMAAYGISKSALVDLTRILDLELRPHGIRVNAVAPLLMDTAANRAAFPAEALANAVAPQAIADVIAFLVSDDAAPVSGAILPAYGA